MYSKTYLMRKIEILRREMTEIALKKGFTDNEAIKISQELDSILNEYDAVEERGIGKIYDRLKDRGSHI